MIPQCERNVSHSQNLSHCALVIPDHNTAKVTFTLQCTNFISKFYVTSYNNVRGRCNNALALCCYKILYRKYMYNRFVLQASFLPAPVAQWVKPLGYRAHCLFSHQSTEVRQKFKSWPKLQFVSLCKLISVHILISRAGKEGLPVSIRPQFNGIWTSNASQQRDI